MSDTLRPYQQQGMQRIFYEWKQGVQSVLFQMPTGTGKTVLFSEIVKKGWEHERKVLIIVHRTELVEQITKKLTAKNIEVGLVNSGSKADYEHNVHVAMIQTLCRRKKHPDADLVIIDECHHATAKSYQKLWDIYPQAKFLGVTATPIRLNGQGFDKQFQTLISSMQVKEFIEQGHLADIKTFVGVTPNLKNVEKRKGDYVTNQLGKVMLNNGLMVNLIKSYQKHAQDKSAIVFAVNIEHSKEIAERYNEAGIAAAHIDSSTPERERKELLEQFKTKEIKVLCNVEIITEGFDFPECEVVQLARPTKSLALYLQMVGRVMRPAKGKEYGLILDNAGLWQEHGLPTRDREWTLEAVKSPSKKIGFIDKKGVVRELDNEVPEEIEGAELIEFDDELERFVLIESLIEQVKLEGHKPHRAFYLYKNKLDKMGVSMTWSEFEYIKRRITIFEQSYEHGSIKPSFWAYNQPKPVQLSNIT